ncbi:MAG: response regulator [Planctomycetes bacterium]|nr:response regulator [Planctomycetota bacterium]
MSQTFRVLLVEDDDSLRCCLGEFLGSHGWEVAATGQGQEAMRWAMRHRFDFSILDFHLPGITGLELFQQLTSIRPLPSILMSGLATIDEAAAARHAGFFAFLRKPLELDRLRQSVQQLIQTHFGGPLAWHPSLPPGTIARPPSPRRTGPEC